MCFPISVLRLSIVPLLTPLASLFGFAGSWLTWMLHSPLPLLFIVTIVVLSTLLIMISSMNAPSTLRSTAISLASISRKEISSCSPSPLLTSLLISQRFDFSSLEIQRIKFSSLICCRIDCSSPTSKVTTLVLPQPTGSTFALQYTVGSIVCLLHSRDRP